MMFGLPDFEAIRRENSKWREEVKALFVTGIDPADLKAGDKVTISPNLRIHDRSYTNEVLTVKAVNSCHVQVLREKPLSGTNGLVNLLHHEHHFYLANDFEAGETL